MIDPKIGIKVSNTSEWMSCPKNDIEFPGLAYICPLNELVVVQKNDALHEVIGIKGIGYTIFNNKGQKVFLAIQEKRFKKFNLKIFNLYGNEVIHVKRPFRLCLNSALVWAPPGHFVGSVKEERSCVNTFLVKNQSGETLLKVKARGLCHFVYDVQDRRANLGVVMKRWRMAAVLNDNNFGVSFPINMDSSTKAMLLGAAFLIGCLKY